MEILNIPSTHQYTYDANGNMTEDQNKGIEVEYNHLNLPTKVIFDPGKYIEWTYDAAGIKLSKKVFENSTLLYIKDYSVGIEYLDEKLEAIYHSEGRLTELTSGQNGSYQYEYTLKEHLGNSRVMFSDLNADAVVDTSEILQANDYYPFGMNMEG